MKVTVQQEPVAEPELIVRCSDPAAAEITALLHFVSGVGGRLPVRDADGLSLLAWQEVLYAEFVGRQVFVYTQDAVYPTGKSLAQLSAQYPDFVRCAKSMVVNLRAICKLRSAASGRILATMQNGEDILISRHYAAALRRLLASESS